MANQGTTKYRLYCFVCLCRGFQKGFTFIEILIIVLLMGIMATIAFPSIQSGLEASRLTAAAGEITVALEYGQLTAMTSGGQTRVTIDADADSILVERFEITGDIMAGGAQMPENDIDTGTFENVAHPFSRGEDYAILFADEDRLENVDIGASTFGAGNFVTFDAFGSPSDGGTVTLTLGVRQVTLTVDSLSGRVTAND
jgi:Tfp pilus assembly protein FimT